MTRCDAKPSDIAVNQLHADGRRFKKLVQHCRLRKVVKNQPNIFMISNERPTIIQASFVAAKSTSCF